MKTHSFLTIVLLLVATDILHGQQPLSTVITALRDTKSINVSLEELVIEDKETSPDWNKWFPQTLNHMLDQAGIQRGVANPDMNLVFRARISLSYGDYVSKNSIGTAPIKARIATGATVKGTLRMEHHGKVVATWPFEGSRSITAETSSANLANPITIALENSGIHRVFLAAMVEARGHEFLKAIFQKNWGITVSPDWEGRLATYHAIFPVLAASSAPEATALLSTIAKEYDRDPIVRGMVKKAIEDAKQKGSN